MGKMGKSLYAIGKDGRFLCATLPGVNTWVECPLVRYAVDLHEFHADLYTNKKQAEKIARIHGGLVYRIW